MSGFKLPEGNDWFYGHNSVSAGEVKGVKPGPRTAKSFVKIFQMRLNLTPPHSVTHSRTVLWRSLGWECCCLNGLYEGKGLQHLRQSSTSVTWNLQPFHGFSIRGVKHRFHKARNPCACHAKINIISDPLELKSTTPANIFATLTNSCACHILCNVSKSLRLPREKHFEPPKTSLDRQLLAILASKSLSRHSVVQIFLSSTSKSAPSMPVFKNFDFQIALAPQRGANFGGILGSRSFAPPRFSDLPLQAFEATKLWKNTEFRAIPTRQNLSCRASVL